MVTKSRPITVNGKKYRWTQVKDVLNPRIMIEWDNQKIFVRYRDLPDGPMYGRQMSPKVVADWISSNLE